MYPEDFSNYSLENLLQLLNHLNYTGNMYTLSINQKRNLLARLATVRAELDQKVQYLDEVIDILSAG